ncbi:hypothetical protein L873DRAFT_1811225 [Choiromyces venosus 120613-1]|uniref:Uncharacterized protein n=1 Tax=Choiromyces venosus 120613-1 TaxID=1336337 RepID=A0A3N4JEA0_9PEZI|nr:hypothetical protein L873DRAFT_1811225 [Choiromyces venosus 120613-1]
MIVTTFSAASATIPAAGCLSGKNEKQRVMDRRNITFEWLDKSFLFLLFFFLFLLLYGRVGV